MKKRCYSNIPDGVIGEHFLSLFLPERVERATVAVINGERNHFLRFQNASQPRQERVIETTEHFFFKRHSPVLLLLSRPLLRNQRLRHHFQRHALARPPAAGARQEHHALGAAPHGGDHAHVLEVERSIGGAFAVAHGKCYRKPEMTWWSFSFFQFFS